MRGNTWENIFAAHFPDRDEPVLSLSFSPGHALSRDTPFAENALLMRRKTPLLCADIGGSFIDFAVVLPDDTIAHRQKVPTPTQDLTAFTAALETLSLPHPAADLNIAIAGYQSPEDGRCYAANIPCVQDIALARTLSGRLNRVVRVGNDADCFTLAETRLGVAQGHRNVLGIILGTGVGGGVMIDDRLAIGAAGITGEWGHGPVIPDVAGTETLIPCFTCGCGQRGCIDTIGGARGMERLYQWAGGADTHDSHDILDLWQQKDPIAERTISLYLGYVASALALSINLTGASIVPVGGGLAKASPLLTALDVATRARILRHTNTPLLVGSTLGNDAGLLGAAYL